MLYPGESTVVTPDRVTYGSCVYLNMRIRKLPEKKGGLEATHKLQRTAIIKAKAARPYASPDIVVDQAPLEKVRQALVLDVQEGRAGSDTKASMGTPYDAAPRLHLYATAYGWGGLAIEHASAFRCFAPRLRAPHEGRDRQLHRERDEGTGDRVAATGT